MNFILSYHLFIFFKHCIFTSEIFYFCEAKCTYLKLDKLKLNDLFLVGFDHNPLLLHLGGDQGEQGSDRSLLLWLPGPLPLPLDFCTQLFQQILPTLPGTGALSQPGHLCPLGICSLNDFS